MFAVSSQSRNRAAGGPASNTHRDILASVQFFFFNGQDQISIVYKDGRYVLVADYQQYPLPMENALIRQVILQYVPRIDDQTFEVLVTVLGHKAWGVPH